MFGSRSSSKEHRFLEGQVSALRELNLFNPSDSRSLRSQPKKQDDWSSTNSGPAYTEKSKHCHLTSYLICRTPSKTTPSNCLTCLRLRTADRPNHSRSSTWGTVPPVASSRTVPSVFRLSRLGNFEGHDTPEPHHVGHDEHG